MKLLTMATNVEVMFESSDEEIDVVTVDPNDENISNFNLLTRELLADYDEESDDHTDTDSNTENETIDVVNASTISAEIYDSQRRLSDTSKSLDETSEVTCEEDSSKISLKRKRQNAGDSATETCIKRIKINKNQSNNLFNYFDKSEFESSKTAATPQEQISSSPTKISPIDSPKNKKNTVSRTTENRDLPNLRVILEKIDVDGYTGDHDKALLAEDASDIYTHSTFKPTSNKLQKLSDRCKDEESNFLTKRDNQKYIVSTCTNCDVKVNVSDGNSDKCSKCLSSLEFSCDKCSEQLSGLSEALDHLNKSCSFKIYRCKYCEAKYSSRSGFYYHVKVKHRRSEPLKCPNCQVICENKLYLKAHMKFCGEPLYFQCCFCVHVSKYISHMKIHLKTKHMEQFDTIEEFDQVCRKILKKGKFLKENVTKSASNSAAIQAVSTLLSIKSQNYEYNQAMASMTSHYCLQCDKLVDVTGNYAKQECLVCKTATLFQCKKCGKQYKSKQTLVKHFRIVCYPRAIFSCDHCNYTSPAKEYLQNHIINKHMFILDSVDAGASTATTKTRGKKPPADKLKYIILTCTNCNVKMKASDRNSDECPECMSSLAFSCEKCSEQLSGLSEALDHPNEKCGFQYYRCNECPSKYERKKNLVLHIWDEHTRNKPLQCPVCRGTYKSTSTFQVHVKTCSKPPLLCCFCPFAAKFSRRMRFHLKSQHAEQFRTREEFETVYRTIKKKHNNEV